MNDSGGPRDSFAYRASVIDVIDIDGSGTALRLEPIRPSGVINGRPTATYDAGASLLPRPRRTQDEIRALLARTNSALDKIVKIRESMEPFVDFKQFEGKTQRRTNSSSSFLLASSYGSATSEDPIGDRSTGSTESTSSMEDGGADSSRGLSLKPEEDDPPMTTTDSDANNRAESESDSDDDDDDDDDTFSSLDELPPHKEARLERLKHLTVAFHEGLPTEFFVVLTRFLHATVELKTRHSKFNFYKDAFTGSDAVRDLILAGFAEDQPMALRYGNVLVKLGFIEHVSRTDDQLHNHKDHFYRFTKAVDLEASDASDRSRSSSAVTRMSVTAANYRESVLSRESSASIEYDFAEASDEVHALVTDETLAILARVLHAVFERKNKLLFYKGFVGCFLGAEAVNVIRELRVATSLVDAVLIGQALLDDKIIEPIATSIATFQDRYVFYRLTRVQSS